MRFDFDQCEPQYFAGSWLVEYSLSTAAQVAWVQTGVFEKGLEQEDPIYQQTEWVIMMDTQNADSAVTAELDRQDSLAPTGWFITITMNGTQINHYFNPTDEDNNHQFVPDAIAYVLGGTGLKYTTWKNNCDKTGTPSSPSFVVPSTIIGVKRYVYDYFDTSVAFGQSPKQIYIWENPEKEVIHNFVNVADGIYTMVIRVNHAKQTRYSITFYSLSDVFAAVGGTWTSLAGIFAIFYSLVIGTMVRKNVIKEMKSSSDMKFDNAELEKIKERHCGNKDENEDAFEDMVIDCIENNGDPKVVLKTMLLQKDRDQIMIA